DAMTFSSVELFARRAEALDAGRFAVTDENAQIVADIVCRTDGIPLAIELAVPWLTCSARKRFAIASKTAFASSRAATARVGIVVKPSTR
ncbi:MAG TPA: hypothetical protein VIW69_06895, partial [Candidatus Elarobacter sp.]